MNVTREYDKKVGGKYNPIIEKGVEHVD